MSISCSAVYDSLYRRKYVYLVSRSTIIRILSYSNPVVVSFESGSLVMKSIVTELYGCSTTRRGCRSLYGLQVLDFVRLYKSYPARTSSTIFYNPRKSQCCLIRATVFMISICLLSLDLQISLTSAFWSYRLIYALSLYYSAQSLMTTPCLCLVTSFCHESISYMPLMVAQKSLLSRSSLKTMLYSRVSLSSSLLSCCCSGWYSDLSACSWNSGSVVSQNLLAWSACLLRASACLFRVLFRQVILKQKSIRMLRHLAWRLLRSCFLVKYSRFW